jgi:hypothetical protein
MINGVQPLIAHNEIRPAVAVEIARGDGTPQTGMRVQSDFGGSFR